MNKAILVGNLATDPELKTTPSGVAVCTFRIATQRAYINQQTGKREADFHNIVVWRQLGELCAKHLAKGLKAYVEGPISYRSYDAQDGSKRYVTEIVADRVEFLSSRNQTGSAPVPPPPTDPGTGFPEVSDDELPF